MAEGEFGESPRAFLGEDQPYIAPVTTQFIVPFEVPVEEKKLTFEEAARCLNTLGKDESGVRYAYLMITANNMKLTDVSIILNFKHVLFLDLCNNFLNLEALNVLAQMPFLIMLKADRNRVESAALESIPYLQVLSFSMNKIEETSDIAQPMLDTLDLEFNQIFTIQFDKDKLPNLKELDLKGNHLMDLCGNYPEQLERLFLSQNKITKLNSLAFCKLPALTTLSLRDNKIRKLNGFTEFLSNLRYLNLRNNNITKLRQFRKLACLPKLETLILIGNPVNGKPKKSVVIRGEEDEEEFGEDGPPSKDIDPIRIAVLVLLPNLKRINKGLVTFEERAEALLIKDKKLEQIMREVSSDEETEAPTTTTYTSEAGDATDEEEEEKQVEVFDPRIDDENQDEEN